MRNKFVAIALSASIASATGSACAMNAPAGAEPAACRVVGGDKLPPSSGGAEALCAAMAQAAGKDFSVEIKVVSPFALAATVTTAEGRRLPEQRLDVSDRTLSRSSFEWFARSIANEVARARSR